MRLSTWRKRAGASGSRGETKPKRQNMSEDNSPVRFTSRFARSHVRKSWRLTEGRRRAKEAEKNSKMPSSKTRKCYSFGGCPLVQEEGE